MTSKKISNVDSLSALFDRLITERIKHYFFMKEGDAVKVAHQNDIILELKVRIADTIQECLIEHDYDVLGEKRTFKLSDIVNEIDTLAKNDILVGEYDRIALSGYQTNNIDLMQLGIGGFREANEKRAHNKGLIDLLFQKLFRKNETIA